MDYNELINAGVTMVLPHCFDTINNHKHEISKLKGDIIECGVWRGGFSIFLAKTFPKKKIWVADSFQGFQPIEHASYTYLHERHLPNYVVAASLEDVQANFKQFNINEDRVTYLKGFVKDTLPNCGISSICVLRIDVDAYSATLEVLHELYDKVVKGGYIIFDDACLYETLDAIKVFFKEKNIDPYLIHPSTDQKLPINLDAPSEDSTYPTGCYIIKE
jgi:O-methyltransferase